jgi:Putative beta-lactamase-inhibitor-like, PepSY-like
VNDRRLPNLRRNTMRAFIFVLATAFLSLPASAQQTPAKSEAIQIQDVPKEVVDAVKTKFPDAQMQKAKKKVENGKSFFSVGLTTKGTTRSVLLTPKGKFVQQKKVIAASELPAKVAEAVYASYPNSTTKKAQQVTEYKEEKCFQVEVTTADKQTKELLVDAQGKIKSTK